MTRPLRALLAALGAAALSASCGQPVDTKPYPEIDPEKIRTHLERLQAAETSGMAPGDRGEQIAVAYAASVFTGMGVAVQTPQVPLTRIKPTRATITLSGAGGSRNLVAGADFVAWSRRHEPVATADADLMFVGYGINAPRQGWDDYKWFDVRGKILVMLIGDPLVGRRPVLGALGADVFGRARYKFEEAERRGAAGVLLVHLDDRADEEWDEVVDASTEILDPGAPGQFTPHMPIEGWLSVDTARRLFTDASLVFDEQVTKAEQTNFEPLTLPIHARAQVESEIGGVTSTNVIATIPPRGKPQEYVLFSTTWNNMPSGGANGSDLTDPDPHDQSPPGLPVVLEVARALSQVTTPHRGFVFLAVTAAPQGLLGLESYLETPPYAPSVTKAAIQVAGSNVRSDDNRIEIIGLAYEALKGLVRDRAAEQFRVTEGDFDPERLHYFRPARVAYTLKEIPSIVLSSGRVINTGTAVAPVSATTNVSIGVLDARLLFHVGLYVAASDYWPAWAASRTVLDYVPSAPPPAASRRVPTAPPPAAKPPVRSAR